MIRKTLSTHAKTGLIGLFLFMGACTTFADVGESIPNPELLFQRMLDVQDDLEFKGSLTYERSGGKLTSYSIDTRSLDFNGEPVLKTLSGPQKTLRVPPKQSCSGSHMVAENSHSDWYNFSYVGEARVAGRNGYEIMLRPVDSYRLGYGFVIDQKTGLMLKSVATLPDRRAVEQIQFINVDILAGNLTSDTETLVESENLETSEASLGCSEIQNEKENSWQVSWVPEGFKQIRYGSEDGKSQYLFGDGLSTFSIFIEPIDKPIFPPGNTQKGATSILINYISDGGVTYLVTFVGEVPIETGVRVISNVSPGVGA